MTDDMQTPEHRRLRDDGSRWRMLGPYVSDRAWGTVREDDSREGDAWNYLPHDQARSRAYRWGEDGIGGISDDRQLLCFALALWNGRDPILKERYFGLTNGEGNHGEDAKDYWFYLDATPSFSYARMLYKYPQRAFPYLELLRESQKRDHGCPEFELADTGIFADDRYYDIELSYAKSAPDDLCIQIDVTNRGPEPETLHVLPTLWFRNSWAWGEERRECGPRPWMHSPAAATVRAYHEQLGEWLLVGSAGPLGPPALLFTENETNVERLFGRSNASTYVKDGSNADLVDGAVNAVNPRAEGTKASLHYPMRLAPGERVRLELRLHAATSQALHSGAQVVARRRAEADAFYAALQPSGLDSDTRCIQRQAWAGMLWSKQWYAYSVPAWQRQTAPDATDQAHRRNAGWSHFEAADVISMPDKWEYPWFAAWDLGFHCIALAFVDPEFAKQQLLLMVSERYQHPNGAISAYEWNFDDANPPLLARTAQRVYDIEREYHGRADREFLEVMFHKLSLNFAWWVNRKDSHGDSIFGGGFLGLDNIGVFDRSQPLPTGGELEQSDGTAWVAMFSLDLATMALELARETPCYRKLAVKYAIHFMHIARAMNGDAPGSGTDLWDDQDGFYYDRLRLDDGVAFVRLRSMVGLVPLFAAALHTETARDPELASWFRQYVKHRPALERILDQFARDGVDGARILSLVDEPRLERILHRLADPAEFLSDYGVRSLSKAHSNPPYSLTVGDSTWSVGYVPAESDSGMFGGNSNWRGPIWFPLNYMVIASLRTWFGYLGEARTFEFPSGSGQYLDLSRIADALSDRLLSIFHSRPDGTRSVNGGALPFRDREQRELLLFYEYFHGDHGRGLGASHQTGWTGLIAALIQERAARP
jgi:hypothetical protein